MRMGTSSNPGKKMRNSSDMASPKSTLLLIFIKQRKEARVTPAELLDSMTVTMDNQKGRVALQSRPRHRPLSPRAPLLRARQPSLSRKRETHQERNRKIHQGMHVPQTILLN